MNSIDIKKEIGFLQLALDGSINNNSIIFSEDDWRLVYEFSKNQSIIGLTHQSLNILYNYGQKPPFDLLMKWVASQEQIARKNIQLNKQILEIKKELSAHRVKFCILKGQGNSTMYPTPFNRTPGDIDIWVDMKRKDLIDYLKQRYGNIDVDYHHIGVNLSNQIDLEFHLFPMFLHNPFRNRKLQKFFDVEKTRQMEHEVVMPGTKELFPIPTVDFNLVYQLVHMKYHYLSGGIGMRQMIDYYYVLKSDRKYNEIDVTENLRNLGLWEFAGAVMYVMKEALGMEEEDLLVPIDEKRGKSLLSSIMEGGNFGMHSSFTQRRRQTNGHLKRFVDFTINNMKMFKEYPVDIVAETMFRFINCIRVNCYKKIYT